MKLNYWKKYKDLISILKNKVNIMTETTEKMEQMCYSDQNSDCTEDCSGQCTVDECSVQEGSNEQVQGLKMEDVAGFLSNREYKVAVIYSGWSLSTIEDKLYNYGSSSDFGMCRVDRYKGEETNRTICLMKTSFYEKLMSAGYNKRKYGEDFCCTEYKLREHNFPKFGESNNLFLSLPKDLSASECRVQLERKLNEISSFGIFNLEDMKLNLPTKSRENDIHNGSVFITFKREMRIELIALIKILLHDTWWYSESSNPDSVPEKRMICQCYWARERVPRKVESDSTMESTPQPKPRGQNRGRSSESSTKKSGGEQKSGRKQFYKDGFH